MCKNTSAIIIQGQSLEQFYYEFSEILLPKLLQAITKKQSQEIKLLSPKDAARLFSPPVTIQTLHNWYKKGILTRQKIGGKVFFSQSEIMEKRETIKRYNRNIL